MEQAGQVSVALADQGIVEGDVGLVILPQEQLQQGRRLLSPGGLIDGETIRILKPLYCFSYTDAVLSDVRSVKCLKSPAISLTLPLSLSLPLPLFLPPSPPSLL